MRDVHERSNTCTHTFPLILPYIFFKKIQLTDALSFAYTCFLRLRFGFMSEGSTRISRLRRAPMWRASAAAFASGRRLVTGPATSTHGALPRFGTLVAPRLLHTSGGAATAIARKGCRQLCKAAGETAEAAAKAAGETAAKAAATETAAAAGGGFSYVAFAKVCPRPTCSACFAIHDHAIPSPPSPRRTTRRLTISSSRRSRRALRT